MKLVVGLGNPGSQYSGTRHNVGFDVIAELLKRWQPAKSRMKCQSEIWEAFPSSGKVLLATPLNFMNCSGDAVQQIAAFWQIAAEDMVIACDDLNLPLGSLRWRAEGSSGGQKGLADVLKKLGTEKVPRLRLGIGRPPGQMDSANWVLSRFRQDEKELAEVMTKLAADSVETWAAEGVVAAMNRFNRTSKSSQAEGES
jgi:PTH1 family peptidyl-tRNA hydrolase